MAAIRRRAGALSMSTSKRRMAPWLLAAISSMSMPPSVENKISGLRAACQQHGGIELARDLGSALDQQTLDFIIADCHAEDLRSDLLGFRRRMGELDAAGLATFARGHLRLDHAGADLRRGKGCFLGGQAQNPARHRNAGGCKDQRFGGVFFEIHWPYLAQ